LTLESSTAPHKENQTRKMQKKKNQKVRKNDWSSMSLIWLFFFIVPLLDKKVSFCCLTLYKMFCFLFWEFLRSWIFLFLHMSLVLKSSFPKSLIMNIFLVYKSICNEITLFCYYVHVFIFYIKSKKVCPYFKARKTHFFL